MAEWESAEALEDASESVAARFEASGFNPQEVRARLGIEAAVAIYLETARTAGEEGSLESSS